MFKNELDFDFDLDLGELPELDEFEDVGEHEPITYEQVMHDSFARKSAARKILSDLERISGRKLTDEAKREMIDILCWHEIEDGASVFKVPVAPADKKLIGTVKLGIERVHLYFGTNRSRGGFYPYALGIRFEYLSSDEVSHYTRKDLEREFPAMADVIRNSQMLEQGKQYTLHVYPKAGEFWKVAKGLSGEWIGQKPTEKGSFVPSKPIGLVTHNSVYLCYPLGRQGTKPAKAYHRPVTFNFE